MFEHRFLSALATSLGVIALTVAIAAIVEGSGDTPPETRACGLEPVPGVSVSVLRCDDEYDVDRSLVWAIWSHGGHCITESGAASGASSLVCDNGVSFQLDQAADGTWKSCGVEWSDEARLDVSSSCRLTR